MLISEENSRLLTTTLNNTQGCVGALKIKPIVSFNFLDTWVTQVNWKINHIVLDNQSRLNCGFVSNLSEYVMQINSLLIFFSLTAYFTEWIPCMCCHVLRVLYFLTSVSLKPTRSKNSFTTASSISCGKDCKLFFQSFSFLSSAIKAIFKQEMSFTLSTRFEFQSFSVLHLEIPSALQTTLTRAFFAKLFSVII